MSKGRETNKVILGLGTGLVLIVVLLAPFIF